MKPKIIFSEEKKGWIKRPLLSNIEKIIDYRGRTPKKLGLSWSDTGYLALSALNVKNGYIDFNADANYGDQELYDRWMGDNHLHKGQVVFTTEAPMGNVAQIPNDDLYILSQRTIAFEVKHDLIMEDFLATLLRSPKIFNELTSLSSGGTAKGVSQKSLSNLKVCVPASLEEQSAIGSLFRTLDDLLSSYKDNLANYQSLKASMLSKMFPKAGQTVPEIRLDGFEGEWEMKELGDVVKFYSGLTYKPSDVLSFGTLVLRSSNVRDGELIYRDNVFVNPDIVNCQNVKSGDIVVVVRNGSRDLIGKHALIRSEMPNTVIGAFMTGVRCDNPEFINTLLDTKMFISEIHRNLGSTINQITTGNFKRMKFYFPLKDEQQAIGAYFSNLDNLINSQQEKISQLETLKKKLLQDMFI
jgi:restriction modification system DNA specificity domain protein